MKKTLLFLVMLASSLSFLMGQTTIAVQDFEENASDTWAITFSTPPCTNGSDRWDYSTSLGGITPFSGSQFWGIQDLNGDCGGSSESITFSTISVSSYNNISINFRYDVIEFDNGDDVFYTVILDGVNQAEVKLVDGNSNFSTNGTETINIPNGTNTVGFILRISQNGGSDYAGFDNVVLSGDPATPDPEPTNHATTFISDTGTPSHSAIDLLWEDATGTQLPTGYLIQANTTGIFTDPVDGTDPSEDTDLSDNSAIVKVAQGTETYTFSSLMPNTQYYFKMWSYTNTGANIDFKTDGTPPEDNTTTDVDPCATALSIPFTEDFSGAAFPPDCWTSFRGTNNLGVNEDWQLNNNEAHVQYENVSGGNAEDWLVTPKISIPAGGAELTFQARQTFSDLYGTDYHIRVSTNSQTTHADFTTVESYSESDFGTTNQELTADLNAYSGQDIYVAFVMIQDDGDSWFIDDIEIKVPNNSNSDVDLGSAIAAGNIPSTATSSGDAVDILNLDFYDLGSGDMVDTKVTNIRLTPKASNTADWTDHIQGLVLTSGGSTISTGSISITDSQIDIPINAGNFDIPDGSSASVTIAVYLNNSDIADGETLSFMVDADNHGFSTDDSGSSFASSFGGSDLESSDFTIDVSATQLIFGIQPTDVLIDAVMTPAVTVSALDANNNIDTDYSIDISLSSAANFSGSATTSVTPTNGIATFNNLVFSTAATNETLTANSGGLSTATSDMFDITEPAKVIIYKIADPKDVYQARFCQIKNIDTESITLSGWEIRQYNNGNNSFTSIVIPNGTTLAAGEIYTLARSTTNFTNSFGCAPDSEYNNDNGNGNDTYVLVDNSNTTVDIYGVIGQSGGAWSYENKEVTRKNTVTAANTTWTLSEWTIEDDQDVADIDSGCPPPVIPDNDECSNATTLMCGQSLTNETTLNSSANGGATDCSLGRGVWYTFTGNDKKVTVSVDGASGFDPELAIASSSDCTVFHNIGCQDSPSASAIEEITFFANMGVEYYFYVAHYSSTSSSTGSFDITVNCEDANIIATIGGDSCADGEDITSTGSGTWLNVYDNDTDRNIIASILDSENMGTIQTSVYRNTGAVRMDHNDVAYLDRNITIAPATQPSGTVKVRLYLTNSELSALMSADNSISGIGDINITKEDDDTCNGSFQGGGTLVSPTATGSIGSDHYLELDLTSFSSFFAHAGTAVLPVQLSSFTATPQNKTTLIKWTTSQELSNDYMAVERSSDGRNFTEIGRVQGAGNSDEAQQYSLIDKQPMAGVNYYRLRQVDFDGTTHFHKIVSVHFDAVDSDIRIAPTAVANHVMVYLPAVLNNDATINVYDANGRLWQSSQMTAGNAQAQFDFSQLAAGNYFLQIIDGQNLSTLRFTKL